MKRFRSRAYLKWVSGLPCALTGQDEVQVAHIRLHSGMGIKPPDNHVLPLHWRLHTAEHDRPADFWRLAAGLERQEAIVIAERLHKTYPDRDAAIGVLAGMEPDEEFIRQEMRG